MNAVGIDVSKGKSTVAILRPMGEVVQTPIDVPHDAASMERLAYQILSLHWQLCYALLQHCAL